MGRRGAVRNRRGHAVTSPEFRGPVPRSRAAYRFGGHTVRLHTLVADVMPWSAEEPNRYQLQVALLDPEGKLHDTATISIGFRRVEIKGRDFLVNGYRSFFAASIVTTSTRTPAACHARPDAR